ncbi:hypothetical protein VPH35_063543 [Triticum aestivum]
MNRSISCRATAIFRSYPTPSHRTSFHHDSGSTLRMRSTSIASSIARANRTSGKPMARQPGSTPNTSVVVMSNVSLRNTSMRSHSPVPVATTWASSGSRSRSTLRRLHWDTKARKRGADMSSCALARWRRQESPSALKMPPPRMSMISAKSGPLG